MDNNSVDLSIVIINYNTCEMTCECIRSVINNTHELNYEIIVVDNGSTDNSQKELNQFYKIFNNFKLIKNRENLGFAKANNQGIRKASGRAVLLLNSDTEIVDNSIFAAYQNLDKADILTVRIRGQDGTNQQAGGFGPTLLNLFFWAFFLDDLPILRKLVKPYQISDLSFFEKDQNVDWVMGAFFMAKKKIFREVGMLDENIFMYGEEMEFCRRARKEGFKVRYFCEPSIIHFGMGSAEAGDSAVVGEYQALKYFFKKFEPEWKSVVLYGIIKASIVLRAIVFGLFGIKKAKIYEKAFRLV